MFHRDRMIAQLLAMLAELGWYPAPIGDAIDQAACGELLDSDEAAFVSGRRASTVARWAQVAEDEGEPIAIKTGTSWLFVANRLLGYIERTSSLYARREAETRHRKLIETRASSHCSTSDASQRAASPGSPCDYADSKPAPDPDHPIPAARAVGME
jgi:hypothetical protein